MEQLTGTTTSPTTHTSTATRNVWETYTVYTESYTIPKKNYLVPSANCITLFRPVVNRHLIVQVTSHFQITNV